MSKILLLLPLLMLVSCAKNQPVIDDPYDDIYDDSPSDQLLEPYGDETEKSENFFGSKIYEAITKQQQVPPTAMNKKATKGVYIVEAGYLPSDYKKAENPIVIDKNHLTEVWTNKAKETCKHGYKAKPEKVRLIDARIPKFYCADSPCSKKPLISAIIMCENQKVAEVE